MVKKRGGERERRKRGGRRRKEEKGEEEELREAVCDGESGMEDPGGTVVPQETPSTRQFLSLSIL